MNRQTKSSSEITASLLLRGGLALLVFLAWFITSARAQEQNQPGTPAATSSIHVKHLLGFEDVPRNANGKLSIQDDDLQFQRDGKPVVQVSIASIQNISLGGEDKQVGGVPVMLGKAAVPFGGGRVVSLFSHKKYDCLTIEYLDSSGGFHGAIFQTAKGQGQALKDDLIANGAHITPPEDPAPAPSAPEESPETAQEWSVQVDRVDVADTTLDSCFSDAVYENLVQKMSGLKQFKHVFRSGDRNANKVSGLLVLKTVVEKYSPGSETKRAVTTVAGATKIKVQIQVLTRNGQVVLEHSVEGDVRFIGDNLRATSKVANNTTKVLKRSTLPAAAAPATQQTTGKESAPTP